VKIKSTLFAVLALVVMTGVFNPVGVPAAFAQSTSQVTGKAAQTAVDAALKDGRITKEAAQTLTTNVAKGASVTVDAKGALVLSQNVAGAGLGAGGLTGANMAVAAFIVAGVAVLVSGDGTTATTGTTGTTGTR
jgi:hypothetical protein